ncbi:hypothetical protein AB0B66_34525 [Catellatospora sp. NPDC049111]|uniref:hypothetical protein n=1 Tax=Catellatospora sp. NPDC049111 TaxID=3155271 RepID=UPI0033C11E32
MLQDRSLLEGCNVALNESDVVGLRVNWPARTVRLLLHVLAMPEEGPIDADTRRALVFTGVSLMRVLLRRDRTRTASRDYGHPIELADADAADAFLASVSRSDPMYGWRFLDDPELTRDWPATASLMLAGTGPATHTMYWFCECAREEPGGDTEYCIEGDIHFQRLSVERADGSPVPLASFAADGRRWWHGLHSGDPRVSTEAQRSRPPSPAWT